MLQTNWSKTMKRYVLTIVFVMLSVTALAQDCSQDEFASLHDVKGAVSRLLSFPGYTGWDEKTLNRSGDLAAIAIMRSVTIQEMDSPAKARQILLILHMAFAAPQLIAGSSNRTPTAAMLLLDELERTNFGRQPNVISNSRFEIQHNTSTGQPLEFVTLEGSPVVDQEHTQWVASVVAWTVDIKPGMTRKDLLNVFTMEGGLSTRTQRTYVLKQCPIIKVDVEFLATVNKRDQVAEMPEDKIIKISRPYLEYSHVD
jgi:hypothetical protein